MTSLVGHSGSGKSTILNLIPRFYDRIKGDIQIDNQSIYNITIQSLRNNISLVSQETTSSLDSETETKIQEALKILTKDKTTIVIAHRLSTILNSNNIYVIDSAGIFIHN